MPIFLALRKDGDTLRIHHTKGAVFAANMKTELPRASNMFGARLLRTYVYIHIYILRAYLQTVFLLPI